MHGIVSLLDEHHNQIVEQLWVDLASRFDVRGNFDNNIAHFSYHVADGYDFARLEQFLTEKAQHTKPFNIKATGLGIFSGSNPIIYVPLVRTASLTHLHQALWHALDGLCNGRHHYYAPDVWIPHITLGHDAITPANLGSVVQWLNQQALNWEININNFAILRDPGDSSHDLVQRFDFGNHR